MVLDLMHRTGIMTQSEFRIFLFSAPHDSDYNGCQTCRNMYQNSNHHHNESVENTK